jgi:hypothetical protein
MWPFQQHNPRALGYHADSAMKVNVPYWVNVPYGDRIVMVGGTKGKTMHEMGHEIHVGHQSDPVTPAPPPGRSSNNLAH